VLAKGEGEPSFNGFCHLTHNLQFFTSKSAVTWQLNPFAFSTLLDGKLGTLTRSPPTLPPSLWQVWPIEPEIERLHRPALATRPGEFVAHAASECACRAFWPGDRLELLML
jgi:hypothetical protein